MSGSDDVLDALETYAAAWEAGDLETVLGMYADDVRFHYAGTTDLAGTHVGKEAAVAAMVTVSTRAARELLEVVDVLGGETYGALVVRERLTRDDEVHELLRTLVYRIVDRRIAECWVHDEDQALVDHLWRP